VLIILYNTYDQFNFVINLIYHLIVFLANNDDVVEIHSKL